MPYRFDFDSANKILRGRFSGKVTDHQLKEYYLRIGPLMARTRSGAGITDFSSARSSTVTTGTVRQLAASAPAMPSPRQLSFIIAAKPPVLGLARAFQSDGWQTRPNMYIVRTLLEVCVILGVYTLKFDPLPLD